MGNLELFIKSFLVHDSIPTGRSSSQFNRQRISQITRNNKFIDQYNPPKTNQKHLLDPISATGIRLTCLLLIVSFIFVFCTLPISIRSLIAKYLPSQNSTTRWQITQVGLTLLMYLNHAINVVLYCVTGQSFRSECRKLLCNLWLLRELRISCTMAANSDKHTHHHHQQLIRMNRNRCIRSQQERHYISPIMRGMHV